ncbi:MULTISPECIES: succinyl-diaminopimelate desuccinylase [Marivita]|uniref:Succinyl-diaminopimelate desuccinylase n=1 Tax=Marivita cryptomonadis TaxID=505252 RepID=A0A9Q2P206_9RHOB|nr:MULTISPECIES: succinyl-diaminopimelate desuccinylase [Marivita]MCR9166982.1 succinyl-diaminopimelate desuccinylase [Paracoccaceae bacterium]MBM2322877.1 succinyl-diaminopimelate desuccinylase [Marivita cryptomonadis]MBM2332571.1 succinyl-diaminopimelate desuccinylase [Marivita cryptomonadis]MBM2342154.1 succinyl-diaminopimelate desuccinylase [Marivita cryptomonadis]MBM2346707.1 succinyl-diaminopimelate desuccinylase [Marivita cryptomonadis]
MTETNPVDLTAALVRCPSVTPEEGGALVLLQNLLESAGFTCTRVDRGGVSNLFARWGDKGHARTFGFNGHTDVVPLGNPDAWTMPPFGAETKDGMMYGRGSTDMKSGVAAFAAAAVDFVQDAPPDGAVILTITGDEEGDAIDGTMALLDWMETHDEQMSVCLVGEPTSPDHMGQMMKIGRRGSMNAWFTVTGIQGHSAYPHRALNPMPAMARLMDCLASHELDQGTDHFDASTLAVMTIDTGNAATNVIPAETRACINIRFNDIHTGEGLSYWLRDEAAKVDAEFGTKTDVKIKISGEAFLTPPGPLSDLVAKAVETETGVTPELSTTGGTSDARFVKSHCPVVEFGLVGKTMHAVDERVEVAQIVQLKAIYTRILQDYFAQ